MILGVDGGMATGGWALLDEQRCEFLDLGVWTTSKSCDELVSLDRARRCNVHADILAEKSMGCATIVVERISLPPGGGANAMVPISMSWGVIIGIRAMHQQPKPRLLTISPQKWQREVLPSGKGEVDYDRLALAAGAHILRRHPKAAAKLARIRESERNHAIDAAMIALCGALRPDRCDVIAETQAA